MNIQDILKPKSLASNAAVLLAGLLLGGIFVRMHQQEGQTRDGKEQAAPPTAESGYWTCSMHPQVQRPEPGKCPICGMALIKVDAPEGKAERAELQISPDARQLADIRTTTVERRFPEADIRMVGKLDFDETRLKSLTARFPARIERLFVNFTGAVVKKGDHLAEIYSPQLLTTQSALLSGIKSNPEGSTTKAIRRRLELWNIQPSQIAEIEKSGVPSDHFELRAPMGGVVVEKHVMEGAYVDEGDALFKIADLSRLWLNLDAYESDLPWLRYGQRVDFTVEAVPGRSFEGRIIFIHPVVDPMTRTVKVRVDVSNSDQLLKPGMFARAVVHSKMAATGMVFAPEFAGKWISPMHPEIVKDAPGECDVCGMALVPAEELGYAGGSDAAPPLVVPASAVLLTGVRSIVYVESPDAKLPTYEGREVVLGARAGDFYLVEEGISEGEKVVQSGSFKIDSALQIEAKPSMMSPSDKETSSADDGPEEKRRSASVSGKIEDDLIGLPANAVAGLLQHYFDLQRALAGDEFDSAITALKAMKSRADKGSALAGFLDRVTRAKSLDEVRRPHFETLSNAFIAAVRADPKRFKDPVYQMHCPMVYEDRGADWLQREAELKNPYFGSSMLECGETRAWLTGSGMDRPAGGGEGSHEH